MASSKDYLEYILDQLSGLDEISYRAMMGEYIIYYRGKVVGGIYDDRFLVKPVKAAVATMPDAEMELPSSTTLLVLSVMPTLKYQADRRVGNPMLRKAITVFVIVFSLYMVIGRLISGVHWATDIIGSIFLSSGLYMIYRFMVTYTGYRKTNLKLEASNGVQ